MERVRNKRLAIMIVVLLMVGVNGYAETEKQNIKTEQVSIMLPVELPIYVDAEGEVYTDKHLRIENFGTSSVILESLEIEEYGGWELVEYGKDYSKDKVNKREFGIRINAQQIKGKQEIGVVLKPGDEYRIEYDVTIAVQSDNIKKEKIGVT